MHKCMVKKSLGNFFMYKKVVVGLSIVSGEGINLPKHFLMNVHSHLHIAQLMKLHVACISNVELLACSVYITFIYKYSVIYERFLSVWHFLVVFLCAIIFIIIMQILMNMYMRISLTWRIKCNVYGIIYHTYECMKNLCINHDSRMHMTYTPNCTLSVFYLKLFLLFIFQYQFNLNWKNFQ